MLIPMAVFHAVQNMDLMHIDAALKANGYPEGADTLTSSRFLGMNTDGKFVYEVYWREDVAVMPHGNIYVEIVYDKASSQFVFHADY